MKTGCVWLATSNTVGWGHLCQGRFKAFPVHSGRHLLALCRYLEPNAVTAGLVERAEGWRWSSLGDEQKSCVPVSTPIIEVNVCADGTASFKHTSTSGGGKDREWYAVELPL